MGCSFKKLYFVLFLFDDRPKGIYLNSFSLCDAERFS